MLLSRRRLEPWSRRDIIGDADAGAPADAAAARAAPPERRPTIREEEEEHNLEAAPCMFVFCEEEATERAGPSENGVWGGEGGV